MTPNRQRWYLLLPAAVLWLLPGCFGVSQNPSYFPHLLPTGDIIRTHAKPPGKSYFTNFDPVAVRLEVRPLDLTNPVRTQHVLIATVYDAQGTPRRNRRVEWMLEGVGHIVEVDESGYFAGRGYKVDNRYAVSYTDYKEHVITRGNDDPSDDFTIRPGQSWCVISSAVEGDTHVTVYAPGINNWDAHKVVVSAHWVDAEWVIPPPAAARAGSEQVLVTNVFKHTDRQPLANYRVRYRILDGPPAVFKPSNTQEFVAVSDLSGNATATLVELQPQPGLTRIGIEIIRPPDPTSPSGTGIVIGRGETSREWQAPQFALTVTGPPTAGVNEDVTYAMTVANAGQVEIQAVTLRVPVPDGLQFVRSQPAAVQDGSQLIFTLGALIGGQAHSAQVTFHTTRPGPVQVCANVTTPEGLRDEKCVTTQVGAPQLAVSINAPETAVIGAAVTYQVVVSNRGPVPAANINLAGVFDAGLEHGSGANPVELSLGTLGPNETKTVPLTLTPRKVGTLVLTVRATGDGNLRGEASHSLRVTVANLKLSKLGPLARYTERPVTWDLRVENTGQAPLTNVVVRDPLPREVAFVSATENGQLVGAEVVWNVGTLRPGEVRPLQVTARCLAPTPEATNVAVAPADPGLREEARAKLRIVPRPGAFLLEVSDDVDPISVGGRVTYRIAVTNTGATPVDGVEIFAQLPPELAVLNANGPTQPRIAGQQIVFPKVDAVAPGRKLTYYVLAEARQVGDVRFRVELRSPALGNEPVIEEESTNILPAGQVRPPAPAPQPAPAPAPTPVQPPAAVLPRISEPVPPARLPQGPPSQ